MTSARARAPRARARAYTLQKLPVKRHRGEPGHSNKPLTPSHKSIRKIIHIRASFTKWDPGIPPDADNTGLDL